MFLSVLSWSICSPGNLYLVHPQAIGRSRLLRPQQGSQVLAPFWEQKVRKGGMWWVCHSVVFSSLSVANSATPKDFRTEALGPSEFAWVCYRLPAHTTHLWLRCCTCCYVLSSLCSVELGRMHPDQPRPWPVSTVWSLSFACWMIRKIIILEGDFCPSMLVLFQQCDDKKHFGHGEQRAVLTDVCLCSSSKPCLAYTFNHKLTQVGSPTLPTSVL
jgi:hypothetical protein